MIDELLHIFSNTPIGREILLQSIYFCKKTKTQLKVFLPAYRQFLMYFGTRVVTVELGNEFLKSRKTAREHAEEIIRTGGLKPDFIQLLPEEHTSTIPNLPTDFSFMSCPRSISNLSTKINLGHIGINVRRIINNSSFPILIPTPVYKEWKSITAFLGGSPNSLKVLKLSRSLSMLSGIAMQIFTQSEKNDREYFRGILEDHGLLDKVDKGDIKWLFFNKGKFIENFFAVPQDSLIVVGSVGHGMVKDLIFGSKMEMIQTILPNNLLIVGPKYAAN